MKIVNRCPHCQKAVWGVRKKSPWSVESRQGNFCPHCDGEIILFYKSRTKLFWAFLGLLVAGVFPAYIDTSASSMFNLLHLSDYTFTWIKLFAACVYYWGFYVLLQRVFSRYLVWVKPVDDPCFSCDEKRADA